MQCRRFLSIILTAACVLWTAPAISNPPDPETPALSASEQALYDKALQNYANIAYMLYRDTYRAGMDVQRDVSAFTGRPSDASFAQMMLSSATLYGAFLKTAYIYNDREPYGTIRRRLLPPDSAIYIIGEPYGALYNPTFTGLTPPAPAPEDILAKRSRKRVSTPVEEGVAEISTPAVPVYEGFGALRLMLRLPASFYAGYGDAQQARRVYLQLVTDNIVDDVRTMLSAYRPADEKNISAHLLMSPTADAWRRITRAMKDTSGNFAEGEHLFTPDARRYGDATNILNGLRTLITGSHGRINGPGLAALALSTGTERAGFLNFAFDRAYQQTLIRPDASSDIKDTQAAREPWRALAEALNIFK